MTIDWTTDHNGCPIAEHDGWTAHVIDHNGRRTAELDGPGRDSAHMDGTTGRLLVYASGDSRVALPLPLLAACIEKLKEGAA